MFIFSHHQTKRLYMPARMLPNVHEALPVEQLCNQKPFGNLINIPETKQSKRVFRASVEIRKMVDRRRLQRDDRHNESDAGAAAALKNASLPTQKATSSTVSSYLILSRVSLGAISTINTLAVINTVLRQPMARKGSGPT